MTSSSVVQIPQHSQIATFQRLVTVGASLNFVALVSAWWWLGSSWMLVAALAVLVATHGVIFIQCMWMLVASRGSAMFRLTSFTGDSRPGSASVSAALRVCWREGWVALRVFGWEQPWRWKSEPNFLPEVGTKPLTPGPGVVFVHGYYCNRGLWRVHMRRLRRRGVFHIAVNLEPSFASIDDYAPIIEQAVTAVEQATNAPVVLVCHSMGGLAVRAWLRTTQPDRVKSVITIGTPHLGTSIAVATRTVNGRQMRSFSGWLLQLLGDEAKSEARSKQLLARFKCVYSDGDNIVFPFPTAVLPGSKGVFVPTCGHVELVNHPIVLNLVDRATDRVRALAGE